MAGEQPIYLLRATPSPGLRVFISPKPCSPELTHERPEFLQIWRWRNWAKGLLYGAAASDCGFTPEPCSAPTANGQWRLEMPCENAKIGEMKQPGFHGSFISPFPPLPLWPTEKARPSSCFPCLCLFNQVAKEATPRCLPFLMSSMAVTLGLISVLVSLLVGHQ